MLPVFCVIFIIALYIYTKENRQLSTTASAVRQIWSGGCHSSCRHSGFSGLNGLGQSSRGITSRANSTATSQSCACEPCPCDLLENALRRCDPVTEAYTNICESIADLCDNVLKTVAGVQDYISRVSECRVSCQRQDQASGSNLSNENSTALENIHKDKKGSLSKLRSSNPLSKLLLAKKSNAGKLPPLESEKTRKLDMKASKEYGVCAKASQSLSRLGNESADSDTSSSCPRCTEKGKVCIGGCPKSALHNKQ